MWKKYSEKLLKQLFTKYPQIIIAQDNYRLFYLLDHDNYRVAYSSLSHIGNVISSLMRDTIHLTSKASSKGSGGGFSSGGSDSGGGSGGSSGVVD